MHSKEWNCKATRIAHWQQRVFRAVLVPVQYTALQGMSLHSSAPQSNADRSLATGSFPGRFGPIAPHRNAWHCSAMQSIATQFKATRIGAWQQALFRAALARAHRGGPQGNAPQSSATHGSSKQRGLPTGNSGFSGPLWSEGKAYHRTAPRCSASRGIARQCNSKQRGLPTGNSGFSGPLWLTRPGFLGRFIN